MAHQTSKTSQKQSTPHSIGRLMDADFFGGQGFYFSLHIGRESEQFLGSQTDVRLIKSHGRLIHPDGGNSQYRHKALGDTDVVPF
jgi:hypothetical protein